MKRNFRKFDRSSRIAAYRAVYELNKNGLPIESIRKELASRGITNPKGFGFTKGQIVSMITYLEKLKANKTMKSSLRVIVDGDHLADSVKYSCPPMVQDSHQLEIPIFKRKWNLDSQIIEDLITSNMNDRSKIELLTRLVRD